MTLENKTGIVRNIQTNFLYRHLGGDRYRNLATGTEGTVEPDKAKEIFRLNVAASEFCNGNENIELLIEKLGLRIYHND